MSDAVNYVAGFLFTEDLQQVALISKLKPAWQRGKLNAIGGKIERDESAIEAMVREFREETSAHVLSWRHFAVLRYRGGLVYFFETRGNYHLMTVTAEPVVWVTVESLPQHNVVPNVRWLLPLALDQDGVTVVAEDKS